MGPKETERFFREGGKDALKDVHKGEPWDSAPLIVKVANPGEYGKIHRFDLPEGGDFVAVDPELLEDDDEDHVRISEYGRTIIHDKKELMRQTRNLDPEQRMVVDKAVGFAKKIKRARAKGRRYPDPPHLMVHGAAGTGNKLIFFEI